MACALSRSARPSARLMGERITARFTMWRMRNCRAARISTSSLHAGEVAAVLPPVPAFRSALCPLGAASGITFEAEQRGGNLIFWHWYGALWPETWWWVQVYCQLRGRQTSCELGEAQTFYYAVLSMLTSFLVSFPLFMFFSLDWMIIKAWVALQKRKQTFFFAHNEINEMWWKVNSLSC